jgi:hypothetical protein
MVGMGNQPATSRATAWHEQAETMSLRVCSQPGCATLIDTSGYCPSHARDRDKARGSRQQRGYVSGSERGEHLNVVAA